jgi:hypothetical protein
MTEYYAVVFVDMYDDSIDVVKKKSRPAYSKCMNCSKPPEIDVQWANGHGRAWFCKNCYFEWLDEDDEISGNGDRDIVRAYYVTDGVAPRKLDDHKRSERVSVDKIFKGGKGSGHFGHSGRPGKVGGSTGGKGFSGGVIIRSTGSEARAEFDGTISVNENKWVELSESSKRLIVAHEIAHQTVEDFVLKNNDEWDLAEEILIIEELPDGRKLFIGGNTRLGESIADTVGERLISDNLNNLPRTTEITLNWVDEVVERAGYNVDKLSLDVERIYVEIESNIGVSEEKQLPISESSKKNLIQIRTNIFNDSVEVLAEQVYSGDISIGAWEEQMKVLIRGLHTSTAAIGKGGWDNMESADWGRLGTPLREQYRYLHGFAEAISDKRDTISLAQIKSRSRLYGGAGGYSAALMEAGSDIESQLPFLPRDGSSECLNGCKCRWELEVTNIADNGVKTVKCIWKLSPAEHCDTCKDRNGYIEIIKVDGSVAVPNTIGGYL